MESPRELDAGKKPGGPEPSASAPADEWGARAYSLLRSAVEATQDGILVVDREGRIALYNQRFLELWRLSPAASLTDQDQRVLQEVLPQLEDPEAFVEKVRALYAEPSAESEDELRLKDGRVLERFSRPQRLGEEIRGRVWSFHDITARRAAILSSERDRSLLRAIVESTQDGLLVVDLSGNTQLYNERFARMWRIPQSPAPLSRQELIAHAAPQLEDPDRFLQRAEEDLRRPQDETHDVLRLRDGRIFERFSQPQWLAGERVGRVLTFRDVTQRERLLERAVFLADSSRLLASLDAEQAAEAVGRRALPLLGDACALELIPEDAPPRRLFTVSLGAGPLDLDAPSPRALAGDAQLFSRGGRGWMEIPLRTRDALLGVLTFRAVPARPFTGSDLALAQELAHRMTLSFDNARLFHQAREALRTRDEFLSVAAHELRGPATALKLVLHGLSGAVPTPQRARLLALADRQVRHIARFVDELLDVTRLRGQRMHLELEEVDLASVAREVASRLREEVSRSGSALSVRADRPVVGRWDRLRLEQLVGNLLGNALKFGRGREITLRVLGDAGEARLQVTDHGIGIPAGERSRIFQAFERAASPRHFGGLGLGLYISRSIATALGGEIEVESEEGHGSTFTVTLPRAEAGASERAP